MCKCEFCEYSILKNGQLHCPWQKCRLYSWQIENIMKYISGNKKKRR